MEVIICWLFGHRSELKPRKQERFVRFGEKIPAIEVVFHTYCSRCGAWQHPVRLDWSRNP